MSDLFSATYNPDVLSCLANLSNDEVFTPPEVVNKMLDMLPEEIWSDKNAAFLDPACKSGVFLREIAKRLIEAQLPNYEQISYEINEKLRAGVELDGRDIAFRNMLEDVIEHVFKNQVFGIAITELTSLLSRRSVYCSKYPQSEYSVVRFDNPEGRIDYKQMQHTWKNGKCVYCGASEGEYDREEGKEQYAYEFIHLDNPEEVFDMKFDVIIGNPPYQMSDGGNKASAKPIYHQFVEQAKKLNPRYLTMVIPARWYAGGKGLDSFRQDMLTDKRINKLVDYPDSKDCFPGVDIAGGICYFLWDRDHPCEICEVVTNNSNISQSTDRRLDEYETFIRDAEAVSIIQKVAKAQEKTLDMQVSSRKPFGLSTDAKPLKEGDIQLRYLKGTGPYKRELISTGNEIIDKWKVIASYVSFDHAGRADKDGKRKVLSVMNIIPPGTVCTETYLVYGAYESEQEAQNLKQYLSLKLPRFLIAQLTAGQHVTKGKFALCPIPDVAHSWTDEELYRKYELTKEEIGFIESRIREIVPKEDE